MTIGYGNLSRSATGPSGIVAANSARSMVSWATGSILPAAAQLLVAAGPASRRGFIHRLRG